tara:strand:+ start:114 stop:659 length:546 start_codon:yes stop_codon:yes gene_type:complete
MSKDCDLGVESVARSELAIEKFSNDNYEFLITIGWAYRADCTTPIADVVSDFILDNSNITRDLIKSLTSSRDTVGDAYYCLEYLSETSLSEIHIVTSDYHMDRVNLIFNRMFGDSFKITVFGAKTEALDDQAIIKHEKQSIEAFARTFKNVDFSSKNSIFTALASRHPFYNGKIYPKISPK